MPAEPTVLIVDDDVVTRAVVRAGLTRRGTYRVLTAPDGMAAQAILLSDDVDLVITDLLMPRLSGLDLIRWAKANSIEPAWIILSGLETFDAAVEAIQVGAFDFQAKPLALPRLEVAVRNALEHRRLVAERDRLFAALAAESAVIQRDLERAAVIQRALLPSEPPTIEGYAINALYRPGNHVGGDLYNVIRIGTRHLVLFVADATGHGVSSAMLSVLFSRRLLIRDDSGAPLAPATVLARVNHALCAERVGAGLFLTAAYAVLDLENGELRFAAAGHPPVVLSTAAGEVRELSRTGPVLGLAAEAHYTEIGAHIGAGDRLFFYTDGLLQHDEVAQRHAIESGLQSSTDGRSLLKTLLEGAQHPGVLHDDVTLLLLHAAPGPSHFENAGTGTGMGTAIGRPSAVWYGETDEASVLQVRGRGMWVDCDAFHDTASAIADDLRPVVIDLSLCDYLDSTFLGTIHELVTAHRVLVQGLTSPVRATFEELDMGRVLGVAKAVPVELPEDMQPLSAVLAPGAAAQKQMLRAHETLAALSENNRRRFGGVVDALRAQSAE